MLRTFVSGLFGRAPRSTCRKALVSRLALESLETREVPAADTWLGGGLGEPTSWSLGRPPETGDDVIFSGTSSNASLALPGSPLFLNSIQLVNGYSGTVSMASNGSLTLNELVVTSGSVMTASPLSVTTLTVSGGSTLNTSPVTAGTVTETGGLITVDGAPLITGALNLSGGTIDQPVANSDITVTDAFDWTDGTLNGSSNGANLLVDGTGTIAPLNAGTLATNDTIQFGSLTGAEESSTMSAGTLSFESGSAGMFVNANADLTLTANGATVAMEGVNVTTQKVTVEAKGTLNVKGGATVAAAGTLSVTAPIYNSGTINLTGTLKSNFSGGDATTYAYTQYTGSSFQIQNDDILTALEQLDIQGGTVQFNTNSNLTVPALQTVNIIGSMTLEGGTIQFSAPITLGTTLVYGTVNETGNVTWTGGTYAPGVDYTTAGLANQWIIVGTMSVTPKQNNGDVIQPMPQNVPANGNPPVTTWKILTASKVANNNLPVVNKDAKGNQLTLKTQVVNNSTVWSLSNP